MVQQAEQDVRKARGEVAQQVAHDFMICPFHNFTQKHSPEMSAFEISDDYNLVTVVERLQIMRKLCHSHMLTNQEQTVALSFMNNNCDNH